MKKLISCLGMALLLLPTVACGTSKKQPAEISVQTSEMISSETKQKLGWVQEGEEHWQKRYYLKDGTYPKDTFLIIQNITKLETTVL